MSEDHVRVAVFGTRLEAEVARTALTARGIPAWVVSDDGGGAGGLALSIEHGGVEVQVRAADLAAAAALLEEG